MAQNAKTPDAKPRQGVQQGTPREKTQPAAKKSGAGRPSAPSSGGKKPPSAREQEKKLRQEEERRIREICGIVLIALGGFLALTHMAATGVLGEKISGFTFGLTGIFAYILPYIIIAQGVYVIATAGKRAALPRAMLIVGVIVMALSFIHVFFVEKVQATGYLSFLWDSFELGETVRSGGGLLGALLSYPSISLIGKAGSWLLFPTLALIQLVALTNLSLQKAGEQMGRVIRQNVTAVSDAIGQRREERRMERKERKKRMNTDELAVSESAQAEQEKRARRAAEEEAQKRARTQRDPLEVEQKREPAADDGPDLLPRGRIKLATQPDQAAEPITPRQQSDEPQRPTMSERMEAGRYVRQVLGDDEDGRYVAKRAARRFAPWGRNRKEEAATEPAQEAVQSAEQPALNGEEPQQAEPLSEGMEPGAEEGTFAPQDAPQARDPLEKLLSRDFGKYEEYLPPLKQSFRSRREEPFEPEEFWPGEPDFSGLPVREHALEEAPQDAFSDEPFYEEPFELPQTPRPRESASAAQRPSQADEGGFGLNLRGPVSWQEEKKPWQQEAEKKTQEQTAERLRQEAAQKNAPQKPKNEGVQLAVPQEESVYAPPPISILKLPPANPAAREDPREKARLLEETLGNFGISAKVTNVTQGPVITRYELQPAPGVRVNRITNLSDDIALSLAAPQVRIQAPIPGKAAIGIEVPNKITSMVTLRELIGSEEFRQNKAALTIALGKDIAGRLAMADIAKMPHLLIAGTTGSGKSVCINCIICSIVYHSSPDDVRLIMVDPKVVELAAFSNLPHLLVPVVTEPKKAAGALRWAVQEMIQRYNKFAKKGARELTRYNELIMAEGQKKLPKIVVIIDELADLMMVAPDDVEDSICRIAQLGRAAGIHLVVATQRPSADVITGLIKANITSRIAFAVASATDSRIILDSSGAEKLLGKGDMLFSLMGASPKRVQGALVTDVEVEQIHDYFDQQAHASGGFDEALMESINSGKVESLDENGNPKDYEDDMLPEAVEVFLTTGQASISMLQRRLRIGYNRAARLIDLMEERGIVSGFEGSKPRKLLIGRAEFAALFGREPNIPDLGS